MNEMLEKIRNELQKNRPDYSSIVTALNSLTTAMQATKSGLEVYTTATLPSAVTKGAGFPVFNTDDRMVYVSDGASWVPISSVSLGNFAPTGAVFNNWVSSPATGTAMSTAVLAANTLYGMPFLISQKRVIDRVAVCVTAFVAGNVRLGLYRADASGRPAALVADFGQIVVAANAVYTLSAAPLPLTLGPGLYFLALVSSSASTIRGFAVAGLIPVLGVSSALGTAWSLGFSVAFPYAALPDPFTAGFAVRTAAPLPAIFARFSS
jgi:hypothetical protein